MNNQLVEEEKLLEERAELSEVHFFIIHLQFIFNQVFDEAVDSRDVLQSSGRDEARLSFVCVNEVNGLLTKFVSF
jgi:hypothetical protein